MRRGTEESILGLHMLGTVVTESEYYLTEILVPGPNQNRQQSWQVSWEVKKKTILSAPPAHLREMDILKD
jgi:hypothetical protein